MNRSTRDEMPRSAQRGWPGQVLSGAVLGVLVATSGCGAPREGTETSSEVQTRTALRLPDPAWRLRPEVLDADSQGRQDEVDQLLAVQHMRHVIVATTQTYAGDIYDWVDPSSVPGSQATPPSPLDGTNRPVLTELDAFPELRGPKGTIPMLRPTYRSYVNGSSGKSSLSQYILDLPSGQPSGQNRLYGGYLATVQNHGAQSSINQFPGVTEAGTFTLLEDGVTCFGTNPSTTQEIVGAAVARGVAGYDGTTLRLDTEFWTAGTSAGGNNIGGWNTSVTGWVPLAGAPYGPGVQLGFISVPGGTQYESPNVVVQKNSTGWWIAHNGHWLGYYPSSLFKLMNSAACQASWYGEVFDPTPTSWTTDDMGEGGYDFAGFGWASYFHDVWFFTTGDVATYANAGNSALPTPIDNHCYTTGAWNSGGALGANWFYLGGPGHTSTDGCK